MNDLQDIEFPSLEEALKYNADHGIDTKPLKDWVRKKLAQLPKHEPVQPPCDNCGNPAVMVGDHPEAGHGYVCNSCWRGQGFKNLKAWDHWRKPLDK